MYVLDRDVRVFVVGPIVGYFQERKRRLDLLDSGDCWGCFRRRWDIFGWRAGSGLAGSLLNPGLLLAVCVNMTLYFAIGADLILV